MASVTVVHPRGETTRDVSDLAALNTYVINRGWTVQGSTYAAAYQSLTGKAYAAPAADPQGVVFATRVADATGDAGTDTARLQAALADVAAAGGGAVHLGRGTYQITPDTLTITGDDVSILGLGNRATVLRKTGPGRLLDVSGAPGSAATARHYIRVSDLQLHGNDNSGDLVRGYYTQHLNFSRVQFRANLGVGFNAVQCWDTLFDRCRFDYLGAAAAPAVWLKRADQGITSGFGFSADTCNNVVFQNCTWEQNPGTDLHMDGRDYDGVYRGRINECHLFGRSKMENVVGNKARPFIRLENVDDIAVDALQTTIKGASGGAPLNAVEVVSAQFVTIGHYRPETVENATPGARTALSVQGAVDSLRADIAMRAEAVNKPTVGIVEITGADNTDLDVRAKYVQNPGNAPVIVGALTASALEPFGFPYTVEPGEVRTNDALAVPGAGQGLFLRVRDGGFITRVGVQVAVSSGNVSVAVYRNTGRGRTAAPAVRVATSGAVACPAAGYADVTLDAAVQVRPGDWLAISADNVTATFRAAISGAADTQLGAGRQYRAPASHPLPAAPAGLVPCIGSNIVLVGT